MDRVSRAVFDKHSVPLRMMLHEEDPDVVGEVNWVQLSEQNGRGGGEGILMLTPTRLIFRSNFGTEHFVIPVSEISQTKITRIVIPRFVELHLVGTGPSGNGQHFSFYCTKRVAKSILSGLAR